MRGALTKEQELLGWLLALAELVAKVTYNATDPQDEFDEDSGWWIAPCLKGFLDSLNDNEFSNVAWSALCWEVNSAGGTGSGTGVAKRREVG